MSDAPPRQRTLKRNAHVQYFLRCLRALPSQAQEHDTNRITIAYFCLSGLDLLGALLEKTTEEQRQGWTEWIWRLQCRQLVHALLTKQQLRQSSDRGLRWFDIPGHWCKSIATITMLRQS